MYEPLLESPLDDLGFKGAGYSPDFMRTWITYDICPICKKEFAVYDREKHGYRISAKGRNEKRRLVCSYKCMRAWEKEKIKRKVNKGHVVNWYDSLESAKRRKAECEEKLEYYRQMNAEALNHYDKRKAIQNIERWKDNLRKVESFIEMKETV